MKERIYTIPITDALNDGCGCILCTIEKKLEEDAIAYFLGPSLMEPDGREDTNKNGFCPRHIHKLSCGVNTLGLALMLETHIDELSKKYAINDKKGLFGRKGDISSTVKIIEDAVHSCSVCNKINKQMNNAIENLVYLLNTEKDFEESFFNKGELCAEHFSLVLSACEKEIGSSRGGSLAKKLCDMQTEFLNELKNNLHDFTISFDYRSKNQELSEKAKSSVSDAVKYIGKY